MSTDCIVLRIDEYSQSEYDDSSPVKTMYILYDLCYDSYIIRGKRGETYGNSCYYSFSCDKTKSLVELVRLSFDSSNKCNVSVLNYDNLPYDTDNVTFDALEYSRYDTEGLISVYENVNLQRSNLKSKLKMLKHILNEYGERQV